MKYELNNLLSACKQNKEKNGEAAKKRRKQGVSPCAAKYPPLSLCA